MNYDSGTMDRVGLCKETQVEPTAGPSLCEYRLSPQCQCRGRLQPRPVCLLSLAARKSYLHQAKFNRGSNRHTSAGTNREIALRRVDRERGRTGDAPRRRARIRRPNSRCGLRLPWSRAIRCASNLPPEINLQAAFVAPDAIGRLQGNGENVAATSLITVDFTTPAARTPGSTSESSARQSATISARDRGTRS